MNIPNTLTVGRLLAAAVMLLLMSIPMPFSSTLAFIVFVVASITDYFDGHLARTKYGVTAFGKLMDPLADKVLVSAAFVSFVGIRLPCEMSYSLVPAWIVVVIIAREFAVTGLRLLVATNQGVVISAGNWGKLKTVWQMVAIILTFIGLSLREDWMRLWHPTDLFLRQFDHFFVLASWSLSAVVLAITLVSGWKYFVAHWELVTAEM